MDEQTGPAMFQRVLCNYARAAKDFNQMMRQSGREHDRHANELPERVDLLAERDQARRVEQAIDCLREIADDLEAGLRARVPNGVALPEWTIC